MQQSLRASIRLFETSDGGRTAPVRGCGCSYRPHVRVGHEGEYLGVCFIDGPELISPRTEADVVLALIYHPRVDDSALAVGTRFQILEGLHIVGEGIVTA